MTPLEMIAEWRKGCTNAGPVWERCYPDRKPSEEDRRSPAACIECTEALIEALENKLQEMASTDQVEFVRDPEHPERLPTAYSR